MKKSLRLKCMIYGRDLKFIITVYKMIAGDKVLLYRNKVFTFNSVWPNFIPIIILIKSIIIMNIKAYEINICFI